MSDTTADTSSDAGSADSGIGAIRVRRALISVSDKTGVVDFAKTLAGLGVEILSTGGTATALRDAGLEVTDVSAFTGQEEILDGRVKTLHPRLHAAILARRDDPAHMDTLAAEGIAPIDLVAVNLYPFEQTVARDDVDERTAIENIDIGGPTMIRAAAKNHEGVAVVVKPEAYDAVCAELEVDGAALLSATTRHWLANEAFAQTARYDAAISRWFGMSYEDFPEHLAIAYEKELDLSYGENPHQRAALYSEAGARSHILSCVQKLHGKALSFNNVLDLDAARSLCADFEPPACVIVKHNNPCGVAIGGDLGEAHRKARACDPMSAYGGVLAFNRPIDDGDRRGTARDLRRGRDRARLQRRGAGDPAAEGADPDPQRRGEAGPRPRRTRRQEGARRGADPGARRPARPARVDGGGHPDQADRGSSGTTCSSPGPSAAGSAPTRS